MASRSPSTPRSGASLTTGQGASSTATTGSSTTPSASMDLAGRKWAAFLASGYLTDPRTHQKLLRLWSGTRMFVIHCDRSSLAAALSKYMTRHWW